MFQGLNSLKLSDAFGYQDRHLRKNDYIQRQALVLQSFITDHTDIGSPMSPLPQCLPHNQRSTQAFRPKRRRGSDQPLGVPFGPSTPEENMNT